MKNQYKKMSTVTRSLAVTFAKNIKKRQVHKYKLFDELGFIGYVPHSKLYLKSMDDLINRGIFSLSEGYYKLNSNYRLKDLLNINKYGLVRNDINTLLKL